MPEPSRRPTLRDIAEATGLSSASVSYALRGLHVPAETQERVRQAADRLGYQVNPIARALASGRTGYIGVLCRSLEDFWQQDIAAAIGRAFMAEDRLALLVDSSNDPAREAVLAQQLVDQRVDALICLPVDPLGDFWKNIAQQTVLISLGDALPAAPTAAAVLFDNAGGVTDALNRLAGAGHRRIAVLTPIGISTPDRPAESVVHSSAARLKINAVLHPAPHDVDGAAAVAAKLLRSEHPPTAFLCLADVMAYGVYAAARELCLTVPDDVSVIGFDDHPVSRLLTPPLTSYRWPFQEIVDEVTARTIKAIDAKGRSRKKVVAAEIQLRGSLAHVTAGERSPSSVAEAPTQQSRRARHLGDQLGTASG
jgi:LacI family transcriptional regulator